MDLPIVSALVNNGFFGPTTSIIPNNTGSVIDILPKVTDPANPSSVLFAWLNLQYNNPVYYETYQGPKGYTNGVGEDYRKYLQIGNPQIKALVDTIVSPTDSNDTKAQKILDWVKINITYKSDQQNYGIPDYWALPTQTLKKGAGECKGGAFLIHSMMLAAGIPANRIKTLGGVVITNTYTSPLGGHAWTIYKRESDNQWIDMDWCYYPEPVGYSIIIEEPFKTENNYLDTFFEVSAKGTKIDTNQWGIPNSVYNAYTSSSHKGESVNSYI